MNFAHVKYRGVEATVRLPALLGVDWTARAGGLRFDATADPGTTGKYALRPVTRQIGTRLRWTIADAVHASVEAVHARRAGEAGHTTGNARLQWLAGRMGLNVDVTNLANAGWLDASAQPVARRAAFVGITWR